ncbi:MAG: TauD/TfdA family dioxygenase [Acidimicrobiales bacterium]
MCDPARTTFASLARIDIVPLTTNIGAEIRGLTIAQAVDDPAAMAAVEQAFADHLVLFFRDQRDLTADSHVRFAAHFGPIEEHGYTTTDPANPEVTVIDVTNPVGLGTDSWHSDSSGKETPSLGAVLRAVQLPPVGGDTCWASMYAAYETLSPHMQRFVDELTAIHDFARPLEGAMRAGYKPPTTIEEVRAKNPPIEHPIARTHPITGRKGIYVNGNYTTRICQLSDAESEQVLGILFEHIQRPEFQVRFRWEPDSVAFWDNRCTQHYAVADYTGHRRVMRRVSIRGERPS